MKEHWNRICAGLLVMVLLSACGKGTGHEPLPASPGAGSTDAQQTEAASGSGMTAASRAEEPSSANTAEAPQADSTSASVSGKNDPAAEKAAA